MLSMTTRFQRKFSPLVEDKEENENENPIGYDNTDLSFLFNEDVVFDVKDEHDADAVEYQTAFEWEWNDSTDISHIEIDHKSYSEDRHWDHLYENNVDSNDITRDI